MITRISCMVVCAVSFAWAVGAALANVQPIIFFHEGDRARLDPKQWLVTVEGETVAAGFARDYKEYGGFVLLTGHDQNVGSAEDAMIRTRNRASAVKDVLVRFGVPQAAIFIKACGFSQPIVDAPQGVSEIMNRNVRFWFVQQEGDLARVTKEGCR